MKFIAECGLNHNGNLDLTYELIRQASLSGADIAKFQLGWRDKKNEINNIQPLQSNGWVGGTPFPYKAISNGDDLELLDPSNMTNLVNSDN